MRQDHARRGISVGSVDLDLMILTAGTQCQSMTINEQSHIFDGEPLDSDGEKIRTLRDGDHRTSSCHVIVSRHVVACHQFTELWELPTLCNLNMKI